MPKSVRYLTKFYSHYLSQSFNYRQVHKADSTMKATFHKFVVRILEDGRYAFFRPVKGAHYRLYFLNFAHPKCVEKYIIQTIKEAEQKN